MTTSMYTIILPAGKIPDYTKVRKVTGYKILELRHEAKIYYYKENISPTPINVGDDYVFMCGERSISAVRKDIKLAVDFKSEEHMQEFLGRVRLLQQKPSVEKESTMSNPVPVGRGYEVWKRHTDQIQALLDQAKALENQRSQELENLQKQCTVHEDDGGMYEGSCIRCGKLLG